VGLSKHVSKGGTLVKTYRRILWVAVLLLVLVLPTPALVRGQPDLPLELTGTLHGAEYKILVPENWNGTLLVFARGHNTELEPPAVAPFWGPFESIFYDAGYAQAGSAFSAAGHAVEEGTEDTRRLVQFFRQEVGQPEHVILYGVSMGGMIAVKSIEKYAGVYDGAIPVCGIGSTTKLYEGRTVIGLAYDVTFGWPAEWGTPEDVADDMVYYSPTGFPVVYGQLADPANKGAFEFIRQVTRLSAEDFYLPPPGFFWMHFVYAMNGVTQNRAELEQRAGGNIAHNVDHVYTLSDEDVAAIMAEGVSAETIQGWLDEMNARTNMQIDPKARSYLRRYVDPKGNIKGPVLTVHTTSDVIVPVWHESVYRDTVEGAGRGESLVQVYTAGIGHCFYITPEQYLQAFAAMEHWIETGERPGDEFFPEAMGFDHDFEPPPWPYP
jgi:pimeloyl-ACP methyl ester carboxylesterase